jgi:hypothetical protein
MEINLLTYIRFLLHKIMVVIAIMSRFLILWRNVGQMCMMHILNRFLFSHTNTKNLDFKTQIAKLLFKPLHKMCTFFIQIKA